jgi:hypothetical protein
MICVKSVFSGHYSVTSDFSFSEMSHPGDDGWMQGYSGVIVESNPVKQSKQKSHPRRPFVADLGPLSPHVSDRFPPELVDRILDHLHSDRNTLSSCSLVCKAWLASSRYQLFGNATVRLHQNNAAQFFELLDAPSSIACYICHLEVEEGRFYRLPDSEDSESQVNDSEAGDDGILPRVTGLVSITSLRLRSLHGDLPHAVTRSLMRNFQTLIELELYSCVLESFAQFLCIVGTLPLLQRIRLAFVCWDNELSSAPDNQRPLSHLRDLDFHSSDHVSELLDWLLSYERVPAISHLKLDCITQAATTGQFLYALGPTLEHIVLRGFTDHSKRMSIRSVTLLFHS